MAGDASSSSFLLMALLRRSLAEKNKSTLVLSCFAYCKHSLIETLFVPDCSPYGLIASSEGRSLSY
jgi:hypothetical protein